MIQEAAMTISEFKKDSPVNKADIIFALMKSGQTFKVEEIKQLPKEDRILIARMIARSSILTFKI